MSSPKFTAALTATSLWNGILVKLAMVWYVNLKCARFDQQRWLEFELIATHFTRLSRPLHLTELGVGDDGA
ncbi:MAG: hypothetical protein IPJ25_08505 [Rhodocyclaceae bacterium]|nr:hypothetical protein [Rhodocyclaceae bacterium]